MSFLCLFPTLLQPLHNSDPRTNRSFTPADRYLPPGKPAHCKEPADAHYLSVCLPVCQFVGLPVCPQTLSAIISLKGVFAPLITMVPIKFFDENLKNPLLK